MNHLFHPWLESPEANPRPVGLNDQQHATSRPHFKKWGSLFDTTMILYCTCKQITLFSLNNFSSWCAPLCCMFTGWRPDKSRSIFSNPENAAFPVLQKKVILVKLPAWLTQEQLDEVSFVHVQCWICCSLICRRVLAFLRSCLLLSLHLQQSQLRGLRLQHTHATVLAAVQ